MFCINILAAHKVQFRASEPTLVLLRWARVLWVVTCRIGTVFAAQEGDF